MVARVTGPTALTKAILHWDLVQDPKIAADLQIRARAISDVNLAEICGGACTGSRNDRHRDYDRGDFFALVCNFEGEETCVGSGSEIRLKKGDMMLWRNRGEMGFRVTDWSRQLVFLVPAERFEATLRRPLSHDQLHLPADSTLGALLPGFMAALCQNFDLMTDREAEIAVEMALDLIGLAMDGNSNDTSTRTTLYDRILRYIDSRLQDADLTPTEIANAHRISRRYLHLIFAQQGKTVSGWIRERRLLHCREELQRSRGSVSLTEMAYRWGYCDSAHFSRAFKQRFGMPPSRWRNSVVHSTGSWCGLPADAENVA